MAISGVIAGKDRALEDDRDGVKGPPDPRAQVLKKSCVRSQDL